MAASSAPCVLGIDIGTTSTIGMLLRPNGEVLGLASRPVTLSSPKPGWAEEDPAEWWTNVCEITRELIATSGVAPSDIAGIGVGGMLPAVVLLDEAGAVLRPSIQQSDGRCGEQVRELKAEVDEAAFLARAGNGVNQQLVAAKLRWIEANEPDVFAQVATVLGSYDYVNFRLTGERAVESNWALEAGFVDIGADALDDGLIALTHLPRSAVPRLAPPSTRLGEVTEAAAAATGLAPGTPVVGGAADFIASALAAGVVNAGDVLLKFGGAVDVLTATDRVAPDARMYLDYHLVPGLMMPNGCMSTGGSGLNWFVTTFAGGEAARAEAEGVTVHQRLDRLAAERPAGAEGLTILPYFLGEKTPIHDPDARGAITGLTLSHDIGHLWRALLEAYAYAIRHHVETLIDMGHAATRFVASDGGANSLVWMQIVADVLGRPVQRLTGHPGSCLGCAWVAAIGVGLTDDWSGAARFVTLGEVIQPNPAHAAAYDAGYATYRALYGRLSQPLAPRP